MTRLHQRDCVRVSDGTRTRDRLDHGAPHQGPAESRASIERVRYCVATGGLTRRPSGTPRRRAREREQMWDGARQGGIPIRPHVAASDGGTVSSGPTPCGISVRDSSSRGASSSPTPRRSSLARETVLPTEAIDAVSYGSWNRQYGIRRNSCVLTAGSAKVDFSFEVHPADPTGNMALWWALMQFLDAQVLSRIAGELASRIGKDESFEFDRLHADPQALTHRGRIRRVAFPWAHIRGVSPGIRARLPLRERCIRSRWEVAGFYVGSQRSRAAVPG